MKKYNLTKKDKELVGEAREIIQKAYTKNKGLTSDVSCCLVTSKGSIFTGVDLEGFISNVCAESSAISNMVKAGEGKEKIATVVALYESPNYKSYLILPPCGACRHNMSKFGNPWVIISKTKKVKLKDFISRAI